MERIERLEERVAHLVRTVDELNDVVARQDRELATLTRRVQMLLEREAAREAADGISAAIETPPHY